MALTTEADVGSAATALAQAGYIITACGGNDLDGLILVGTRVKGDTTPRPLVLAPNPIASRGYSMVAYLFQLNATDPVASTWLCVYEM